MNFSFLSDFAFYWILPALALPFFVSAGIFRTFPTRRALALFAVPVAAAGLAFVVSELGGGNGATTIAFGLDAISALVLFADWTTVAFVRRRNFSAIRTTERVASLAQPHDVELTIENRSKRTAKLEIVDDSNANAAATPALGDVDAPISGENDAKNKPIDASENGARFELRTIPPRQKEILAYRLIWRRRGEFKFEYVALGVVGKWGLWRKTFRLPCESTFRVYPNLRQLAQFETLGRANRLHWLGLRRTRRVGEDDEFECLRDYTPDDQYKFIDWKATAKRNKLTVRRFQASKNQRIMLAIDAGRTTTNVSRGVTLFDSALNATLALAYVALKQGDEVGCVVFSDDVKRYIAPRGGAAQMNALICGLYDAFPERVESRYDRAFAYLETKSAKRSLVVLATNVLDERNAERVERCVANAAGRHLPLGLFFRERSLFDAVERFDSWEREQDAENADKKSAVDEKNGRGSKPFEKPGRGGWANRLVGSGFGDDGGRIFESGDEIERIFSRVARPEDASPDELFYRAGAAADVLNWRRRALRRLVAKGAAVLDVFPEDATAPLINKYLEIKARRLL